MEKSDLEKIAEILKGTNILVLSDEIYSELTFGGEKHVSPASIDGMGENRHRKRIFKGVFNDRLAFGVRLRACRNNEADNKNTSVCDNVRADHLAIRCN